MVNAISDGIVRTVGEATGWDATRSVIQTFERSVALYITERYRNASFDQRVAFLFQQRGASLAADQSDPYLGSYRAGYTTIGGQPSPPLGSPACAWCVNGTSPEGWGDVMAVLAAGAEFAAPSTGDLVRPIGSLMVASDWATWIAGNFSGAGIIGWVRRGSTQSPLATC